MSVPSSMFAGRLAQPPLATVRLVTQYPPQASGQVPVRRLRPIRLVARASVGETEDVCPLPAKEWVASPAAASTRAPSHASSSAASPWGESRPTSQGLPDETSERGGARAGADEDLPVPEPRASSNTLARKIWPHRSCAHRPSDVRLLERLLVLAWMPDVNGATVALLLRALGLLRDMDLPAEDVCSVLAHASLYFRSVFLSCGDRMDCTEAGHVLAVLIYLAQTWVVDESCRLGVWHKRLFSDYCSLQTLNETVFRLLELRRWVLRVDEDQLLDRHQALAALC